MILSRFSLKQFQNKWKLEGNDKLIYRSSYNLLLEYKPTEILITLPPSPPGRLIYINYPLAKNAGLDKRLGKITDLKKN